MSDVDRLTGQLMHLPNIIGNLGLNIAAAQTRLDENYVNNLGRIMQMIKDTVGGSPAVAAAIAVKAARESLRTAEESVAAARRVEADASTDGDKATAKKKVKEAADLVTERTREVRELEAEMSRALAADTQTKVDLASAMGSLLMALAPSRYQFTQSTVEFSADLAETRDRNFQAGLGIGLQAVTVNAAYSSSFGYDYRAAARITTIINAIPSDPTLTQTLLNNATAIQSEKLTLPERTEVEDRVWDRTKEIYDALTTTAGDEG